MGRFSAWEIVIVLVILVVVFGAAKLPAIASSLGKSMKIFKKEVTELRSDDKDTPREIDQPGTLAADDAPQSRPETKPENRDPNIS